MQAIEAISIKQRSNKKNTHTATVWHSSEDEINFVKGETGFITYVYAEKILFFVCICKVQRLSLFFYDLIAKKTKKMPNFSFIQLRRS